MAPYLIAASHYYTVDPMNRAMRQANLYFDYIDPFSSSFNSFCKCCADVYVM